MERWREREMERWREREREMEEIRGAAMAYYTNMSNNQQQSFQRFNSLMGGNGNGKVSFQEYMDYMRERGDNDVALDLFKILDRNNRKYLDSKECVTLFYIIKCNRFVFCGGGKCNSHLLGLHFVCVECYRVGKRTFNLCSSCYRGRNFNHEHSSFLDNYDLLRTKPWEVQRFNGTCETVEVSHDSHRQNVHPNKAKMKDLATTAKLYYRRSSPELQRAAWDFFRSLDGNDDAKVCLPEFLDFMRDKGHVKMASRHFFEYLDNDNNGTLNFWEVLCLYYILKSGRPFCGGYCDDFIPGMYFTCSICFDDGNNLFCICPDCFESGRYRHKHDQFMDNFALLETKRMNGSTFDRSNYQHMPSSSVTIAEFFTTNHDVVPHNVHYDNDHLATKAWDLAFNLLEAAVTKAAYSLCTIM